MSRDNVFSPSFGNRPSRLIGREKEVKSYIEGLKSRPGSRERATIIIGQRGMGKTVLLLELAEKAKKKDYIVTSPTVVSDDMLERIIEKVQMEGEGIYKGKKAKLTGGSVGLFGFTAGLQFDREEEKSKSFAYKMSKLVEALNKEGKGVLILIDELQANNNGMKQLIIAYQEMVGAGLNVALTFAGVPGAVSNILNDKVLTFLNRAKKINLEPLSNGEIDAYYIIAFNEAGVLLSDEQREKAVEATGGSPYMMQLVGYYIVTYAGDSVIDDDRLERAIAAARKDYINDICETTVNSLSDVDVRFLNAMLADEEGSKISVLANRMKVSNEYAQRYKKRLLEAGVIMQSKRGEVKFDMPMLREYLEKQSKKST